MKTVTILVSCFILVVTQVARADDNRPNPPTPARAVARPASNVPPLIGNVGHKRMVLPQNRNVGRNYPVFAQPNRRAQFPLNAQDQFRIYQTRQNTVAALSTSATQSQPREKAVASRETFRGANNNRASYFDALRRHRGEHHDCNWWRQHFRTIVFVSSGFYFWDAGYWYPAWGYDPAYNYYDYDGPIYTYGNLLPDQVIVNVQSALQEEGYYSGPVTGSLGPTTRAALANYQRDHGLIATGAIDEPTIESLGLN
jgi:Putative peptidoglycan binding domain